MEEQEHSVMLGSHARDERYDTSFASEFEFSNHTVPSSAGSETWLMISRPYSVSQLVGGLVYIAYTVSGWPGSSACSGNAYKDNQAETTFKWMCNYTCIQYPLPPSPFPPKIRIILSIYTV